MSGRNSRKKCNRISNKTIAQMDMVNNTKQHTKQHRNGRIQRGGVSDVSISSGTGMTGNISTLVSDIEAMGESFYNLIVDTYHLAADVYEIPSDLRTPFNDKGAPGVNNP
jgi:hypothetical protein